MTEGLHRVQCPLDLIPSIHKHYTPSLSVVPSAPPICATTNNIIRGLRVVSSQVHVWHSITCEFVADWIRSAEPRSQLQIVEMPSAVEHPGGQTIIFIETGRLDLHRTIEYQPF